MTEDKFNQFTKEMKITYLDERYLVRDNGAICRQPRIDKQRRQFDDLWTFGRIGADGYRHIGKHPVHRVVATAFHGDPPSKGHVVDHIDTNKENNRPDNLRWVTRAENLFNNPITLSRIENIWGSVEAMLEYFKTTSPEINSESLTPMATQRYWKTPCEFPACPEVILEQNFSPIENADGLLQEYAEELVFGSVFSKNIYGESITVKAELTKATDGENKPSLIVLCNMPNNDVKSWAVARVTIEEGKFVHENKHSYFTLQGALKAQCQLAAISFDNSIDDYC